MIFGENQGQKDPFNLLKRKVNNYTKTGYMTEADAAIINELIDIRKRLGELPPWDRLVLEAIYARSILRNDFIDIFGLENMKIVFGLEENTQSDTQ